jgi:hypothetical protein
MPRIDQDEKIAPFDSEEVGEPVINFSHNTIFQEN